MKKIKEFLKYWWPLWILLGGVFFCGSFIAADANPPYQACFTPGQYCGDKVEDEIIEAKNSIYVQAYSFTDPFIAQQLEDAFNRGVHVEVIFDKSQFKQKSSLAPEILKTCIPTYKDYRVSIAHNKVMIIDGHIVITGSYNFTLAAKFRNAENLLIIDNKDLAAQYMANWNNRKRVSKFMGGCQ